MLKKDIVSNFDIRQKEIEIERTKRNAPVPLWKRLQNSFFYIQIFITLAALVTVVLQMVFNNMVSHMIFCGVLSGSYLFLFILTKTNKKIKTQTHHLIVSILWFLSFLSTIPKVF